MAGKRAYKLRWFIATKKKKKRTDVYNFKKKKRSRG